jgi:hypothetical protein
MPQPEVFNQWRLDAPLWPHIPFAYAIAVQLDARRRRASYQSHMAGAASQLAGVRDAPSLHDMISLGPMLKPIAGGWVIELTDGREVARFTGPAAKRRALRYLAAATSSRKAGGAG